ncbi:hypothetical protein B0J11DRAFT_565465 [Dendryphion nanum]|uniref:Uncharacterized protein n=1 Tax=Dendryphion nanum TaxID=256645 RepID=A0A9P9IV20_9PLEO|nr:hypothetical protein B0J11DRAFT_565465 [Dendryphion nanum]
MSQEIFLFTDGQPVTRHEGSNSAHGSRSQWTNRLAVVQGLNDQLSKELESFLQVKDHEIANFLSSDSKNSTWYLSNEKPATQLQQPQCRVLSTAQLPSQTAALNSLKMRFIQAKRIDFSPKLPHRIGIANLQNPSQLCTRECLPNARTALVIRQFTPMNQGYQINDSTVLFAHNHVSMWFKVRSDGNGWVGIIAFSPPFRKPAKDMYSLDTLPSLCDEYRHKLISTAVYEASSPPFSVISPVFEILAFEWINMYDFLKSDLEAIEFNLETAPRNIAQSEEYFEHLAAYRRRTHCYVQLLQQQLSAIDTFGCPKWNVEEPMQEMRLRQQVLQKDFRALISLLQATFIRINDDIQIILGFQSVYESRESRFSNRIMAVIALIGAIFLPFNCVAAILGIQGDYGPQGHSFWRFWAISIPITIWVLGIYGLWSGLWESGRERKKGCVWEGNHGGRDNVRGMNTGDSMRCGDWVGGGFGLREFCSQRWGFDSGELREGRGLPM